MYVCYKIPARQLCVTLSWNIKQMPELASMASQSVVDVVLLFTQNTGSLDNEDDGEMIA